MPDVIFMIDGPYVSDYLKQTIYRLNIPVVKTNEAQQYLDAGKTNYIEEEDIVLILSEYPNMQIYTNSENALEWIYKNTPDSNLIRSIKKAKNKVLFRKHLEPLNPDYYYRAIDYEKLDALDVDEIPFPVIVKPAVGFFSLGVHSAQNKSEWISTLAQIEDARKSAATLYPSAVMDDRKLIIEEMIAGEEFAVDCYFDAQGQVVILNIMKHLFASEKDVNDRVYISSTSILKQYITPIKDYLNLLGSTFQFTYYPAHIELRIDSDQKINTVEINPLRFGGWCSTPDLAWHAWGLNLYEYVYKKFTPDWNKIISDRAGKVYALIVLNNSTGLRGSTIKGFNYDKLLAKIEKPFELRKTDYHQFPLFGFLMCEVPEEDFTILYELLHSDLKEYLI